jgi:hypothetical protein
MADWGLEIAIEDWRLTIAWSIGDWRLHRGLVIADCIDDW